MRNIFKEHHGMNIVGQGGKIILFMLPALAAAIFSQITYPEVVALPGPLGFLRPVGYVVLAFGAALWAAAVVQLLIGFPQGDLVTTCAYGVVRNPIYSSVTFFILPAVSFITLTWVYFIPAIFLYVGVMIFIGKEEKQLMNTFGERYIQYMATVDRLIPFRRQGRQA